MSLNDGTLDEADQGSCILLVDDLPENLLVLRAVLEELDETLVLARSGAEALRQVLQREFAVILLDVNMPGIDGFETAALIRSHRRSAHTPIIFITAYADEMQTAKGYALGAVDYIGSPVVPEVLRSKVRVFVDLHRMQRQLRRQAEERVALATEQAARRVAQQNERRSMLLADASRQFGAALDANQVANRLLRLLVPRWTQLAILAQVGGEGQLEEAWATLSIDDGETLDVRPLNIGACAVDIKLRLDEVLHSRRRAVLPAVELAALGADQALALRWPHSQRMLASVLSAGERVLGLLLVATDSGRHTQAVSDLGLLDQLTARAAIALDNARLYRNLQAEVAERRLAQDQLLDAHRRKDEFIAMLSHELRNPLAPILSAIEVVRGAGLSDTKLVWASDVIERQVRHLAGLVDELLDAARISQGKLELNKQRVDLRSVVAHAEETARPNANQRNQVLTVSVPANAVWVQGDRTRLAQALANLLHNAVKFSADGGRIEMTLTTGEGSARVSVCDWGIGVDPHLMPHIFDLFSQGQSTLARNQGGLGIGLALVRRLVQLHGGEVSVASAGANAGTRFDIVLPCIAVVGDPAAAPTRKPAAGPTAPRGRRVLVVDDNHDAADGVAMFLNLEGYDATALYDPNEALASLRVLMPDVLVLDIGLPGMDGYEMARRCRLLPESRDALLIALSGYGQPQDKALSREAGFDHHLIKPADLNELLGLISGSAHQADRHAQTFDPGPETEQGP